MEDSTELFSTLETGKYISQKDDPEYLLSFVNEYVKVQLIKNVSFNGFVHSIDPITNSVILSIPQDDRYQPTLLPGHAVIDIYKLPPLDIQPPIQRVPEDETEQEILTRKTKLIAWFKWNLLPVSESGDKIVVKTVNVLPPYKVSDIYAENPVIALQIKKIMERMPGDFVAK